MEVRSSQTGGVATPPGLARPFAGCPHLKGASYQSYLERPNNPTSRGRGVHTYIPGLQDHMKIKLKRGAPVMGTQPLRPLHIAASASKRSPNEIRAYLYILTSFLPSVRPSVLPSFLSSFLPSVLPSFHPSFLPSFLPSFGPYLHSVLLLLRPGVELRRCATWELTLFGPYRSW